MLACCDALIAAQTAVIAAESMGIAPVTSVTSSRILKFTRNCSTSRNIPFRSPCCALAGPRWFVKSRTRCTASLANSSYIVTGMNP